MKDAANPEILVPAGRRAAGLKRMFFLLSISNHFPDAVRPARIVADWQLKARQAPEEQNTNRDAIAACHQLVKLMSIFQGNLHTIQ
jgi:hypothetical protein